MKDIKLPACMMPDGANPCSAYSEMYKITIKQNKEIAELKAGLDQVDHTYQEQFDYRWYTFCTFCNANLSKGDHDADCFLIKEQNQ